MYIFRHSSCFISTENIHLYDDEKLEHSIESLRSEELFIYKKKYLHLLPRDLWRNICNMLFEYT